MFAAAFAGLMFVVTGGHVKNVEKALFLSSSERATAPASSLDVRCASVGVFADETKQIARHNYFRDAHSALQQRAVGCGACYTQRNVVMRK